jgi:hypothetical protein
LRLVANVVERDLKAVNVGDRAQVEVDAFPGEKFAGRIARLSPVLDPATRTAQMEIEIGNREYRLKPGMYARVDLIVEDKNNVLVIPKISLVDSQGERGVYLPGEDGKAKFKRVKVGIENSERAEILEGLAEGETIVSTGAGALRRDDQLMVAGAGGGRGGRGGRGTRGEGSGTSGGSGTPSGPGAGNGGTGAMGQRQPGQGFTSPQNGQPSSGLQRGGSGSRGEGSERGQSGRGRGQNPGGEQQQGGQNPAGRRPHQGQSVEQQRPIA